MLRWLGQPRLAALHVAAGRLPVLLVVQRRRMLAAGVGPLAVATESPRLVEPSLG